MQLSNNPHHRSKLQICRHWLLSFRHLAKYSRRNIYLRKLSIQCRRHIYKNFKLISTYLSSGLRPLLSFSFLSFFLFFIFLLFTFSCFFLLSFFLIFSSNHHRSHTYQSIRTHTKNAVQQVFQNPQDGASFFLVSVIFLFQHLPYSCFKVIFYFNFFFRHFSVFLFVHIEIIRLSSLTHEHE